MRMSKFQTKITHFAKNQKDLKPNKQKIINGTQPWNDRDVRMSDKDFKALVIKMFQQSVYEYAQNKWKSRTSPQQRCIRHKKGSICELKDRTIETIQSWQQRKNRLSQAREASGTVTKHVALTSSESGKERTNWVWLKSAQRRNGKKCPYVEKT